MCVSKVSKRVWLFARTPPPVCVYIHPSEARKTFYFYESGELLWEYDIAMTLHCGLGSEQWYSLLGFLFVEKLSDD